MASRWPDDVPEEEKERRRNALDELQTEVVGEISVRSLGQIVDVLVEEQVKGRRKGRSRTNKLVFFDDAADWNGRTARVRITWTGPWSMIGEVERRAS